MDYKLIITGILIIIFIIGFVIIIFEEKESHFHEWKKREAQARRRGNIVILTHRVCKICGKEEAYTISDSGEKQNVDTDWANKVLNDENVKFEEE